MLNQAFLNRPIRNLWLLFLVLTLTKVAQATPPSAGRPLRFTLPRAPYSQASDKELADIIDEYNRLHTGADPTEYRVDLLRRGENRSALKDLVAANLAGDLPEIAAVDTTELAALRKMNFLKPIYLEGSNTGDSLPFRQTTAILVADQEKLFQVHEDPEHLPKTWAALMLLIQKLEPKSGPSDHLLALPLQGSMGLWLFEALAGKPLWKEKASTIQCNRELEPYISQLQKWIDHPGTLGTEENWETSLQAFIDRKSPLLLTSIDLLPYLTKQATFRWNAVVAPPFAGINSTLRGGSSLIITRDSPGVRSFLRFLYSKENAFRWVAAGAFLPHSRDWLAQALWKKAASRLPAYSRLLPQLRKLSPRTSSPEIVRAQAEWTQALRLLFTDAQRRLPTEAVLSQLDRQMNSN